MLIKDVVEKFAGKARFVSEDWGSSKLAQQYGVKRYPAVFVDDVLAVKPSDFSVFGGKDGKYVPWKEPANQAKFQQDLSHMIDLALHDWNGKKLTERLSDAEINGEISALPKFTLQDLSGANINSQDLSDRVIIVEFWATWCPPCRSTLSWLGETTKRYDNRVKVIAVAIDSEEAEVRKLSETLKLPMPIVLGSKDTRNSFGDINSLPTLFVFDRKGQTAAIFYGAPTDLHEKVSSLLDSLVK